MSRETNPFGLSRHYTYDPVGNLQTTVDRKGRTRHSTYDALNRQTAEAWLDETGTPLQTIHYTYDAVGQVTSASDPEATYHYTYDGAGRVLSVDGTGTPGVPGVLLRYAYDAVGNQRSTTEIIQGALGGTTSYGYDALNRVTQITQGGK